MKILLSIKPEYAAKILEGSKRFEYRRRIHKNTEIETVVIYATKPVGMIVGEFTIEAIHSDCPSKIWNATKSFSGITKRFFSQYFMGRSVAHAIEIASVTKYENPVALVNILPSGIAPQSYAYIQ